MKSLLYQLAKRLKVGGVLRSLDLWVRYLVRRSQSALCHRRASGVDAERHAQVESRSAALAHLDIQSVIKLDVGSWFPPDVTKTGLPRSLLTDVPADTAHNFSAPLRQMVFLSVQPKVLDLSLQSIRNNLGFIKRIVVLTNASARNAIEAIAARHFCDVAILTDDALYSGELPADHTARNTWLRRTLYRQDCIEGNFLASDEDYIGLRPLEPTYYLNGDIHTGYYFRENMGTWLAGSPRTTCFDGGIRNTWRLLREADCPVRSFSSHMPQIINKSVCSLIFDRFVIDPSVPAYDEWSLYFNVAGHLYPNHFAQRAYGTLGWPMRTGDWFPEVTPHEPAFENYYPQNYDRAEQGMFVGLEPLGDLAVKVNRTLEAFALARRIEMVGDGAHFPGILALLLTQSGLAFIATGTVVAGKRNVRRILLINGSKEGSAMKGKLEMFMTDRRGVVVGGESVPLGEVCWIPLLPPAQPGRYALSFFASLNNSGARLETRACLTVIEDKAT